MNNIVFSNSTHLNRIYLTPHLQRNGDHIFSIHTYTKKVSSLALCVP